MSVRPNFIFSALFILTIACNGNSDNETKRGSISSLSQEANVSGSCEDNCGGKSNGSCWCDNQCATYGDCCTDKIDICDSPAVVSCTKSSECGLTEYCAVEGDNSCDTSTVQGTCKEEPTQCTTEIAPICGCDGKTYTNICMAQNAGVNVKEQGACPSQKILCGGITNTQCPASFDCIDDPSDSCDPSNNGVDCSGICIENDFCTLEEMCELECKHGFKQNDAECDLCACKAPEDTCAGICGKKNKDANCWCDTACSTYGDCCSDKVEVCETDREVAEDVCTKNSGEACIQDADCMIGGCGLELCYNPDVSQGVSNCGCSTPTNNSGCGCVMGTCSWYN